MNRNLAQSMTPEWRFILACARLRPHADAAVAAAAGVKSWEAVLDTASKHHFGPLLLRTIESCRGIKVPDSVVQQLQEQRQKRSALNSVFLRQAHEALLAFEDAGLSPIVLKGVALAETLYRDISLRAFCDLDVLFGREEIALAEDVLARLGYDAEATPHGRSWYFENYYQLPRHSRKPSRFCIELHWDFGRRPNPFRLNIDAMRHRAVPVVLAGVPCRRLDPQDELLHLCIHLAWGNGFDGHLRGIVDIAESLHGPIDWDVFEQRVTEANAAQVVAPALQLAKWLLDAPVDKNLLSRLLERRGGTLSRYVTDIGVARVLTGGSGHRTLMRLFWMERFSDRVHLLKQNFGSVEFTQFDARPKLMKRLVGGFRRAVSPFLPHA